MTPLEFLWVEFNSVSLALRETLRFDYGPRHSEEYFLECEDRLVGIKKSISGLSDVDAKQIADFIEQLSEISKFVSLIERSRLGEFSWPFADELRRLASTLLAERDLKGDIIHPIVEVISESEGYRIIYETVLPASSGRRFLVVAFPRSLKYHVLLHTLFGHELCHKALYTPIADDILQTKVLPTLMSAGPLRSVETLNAWLHSEHADQYVKGELSSYYEKHKRQFNFDGSLHTKWVVELMCDIFGLLLFGPSFFAAHQAYLRPRSDPNSIDIAKPTHPPFSVRHKMLVQVMKTMGWANPITDISDGAFHSVEQAFLDGLMADPFSPWADFFTDDQVASAVVDVKAIFETQGASSYSPLPSEDLKYLVQRLVRALPPRLCAR